MSEHTKQQSNPNSTGGGGHNFETRVQAAFTVLMLTRGVAPCVPLYPITRLKLQARYAGFDTDDFIVFSKDPHSEREAKLLTQIKHDVSITASNETFAEVIQSAWNDYNDATFVANADAIALITGPLSATDVSDVRPILEWARHAENEEEFFTKVNTANFSSDAKRRKLQVFKTHLQRANGGEEISDRQVWEFLKVFHLIGYDLDTESGSTLSLLHSLIANYTSVDAPLLWARVVDAVQIANQNAGTLTLDTLSPDIVRAFSSANYATLGADVKRLREHSNYILNRVRTTVGDVHIKQSNDFSQLINMVETFDFIFVTGARGSGKSSLIREFSEYVGEHTPVFCLRTEDLDKPHLDHVFSAIGLRGSLSELEASFALMPKKYLMIESLEKLLELEHTTAFTDLLNMLNSQHGWTVIATGRDYAYQQIAFNFLQPVRVKFATLALNGFNEKQLQELSESLRPLRTIMDNPSLKPLLKSPFFADLAYRALVNGTEFTAEDGEKEFRAAIWRDVIAKEQVRANGMPLKRRTTFVDIAVERAKQMVYGVPVRSFDADAVFKLEEDNLLHRDLVGGHVSLAHDVLEDWALELYIESNYQNHSSNVYSFLNAIGSEPAMGRAFRLWLYQKLRYGEDVSDFVRTILTGHSVERYWQDETIAAILQGNNPGDFLNLLKPHLLAEDGELLRRFCFILRIACQTPDSTVGSTQQESQGETVVDTLFLKPFGQGWGALIHFLFAHRGSLSESIMPHIAAVLNDWVSAFYIGEDLPVPAREAGLLALDLLDSLKDSYEDDSDREKLLSIILKTVPVIQNEFSALLESDVFISGSRKHQRPHYVKELCSLAFYGVEAAFLAKHRPDLLIKLARREWLTEEPEEELEPWYRGSPDVDDYFGLDDNRYNSFPASGAKGPVPHLFRFHPRKALDFVLDLLNISAEKYAYSNLDSPDGDTLNTWHRNAAPVIERLIIKLNDGTEIEQYYSSRLWLAYRGYSVVPYLLQSSLMAFENWLVSYAEHASPEDLEWLFNYVLKHSNSVMPTAVLASLATGFHGKIGRAALPLLRTAELLLLDKMRTVHEMKAHQINEFAWSRDPLSKIYAEERRTAALRPWRQEDLETLIVRLQFSELGDDTLAAIDVLRAFAPDHESVRFLLHRIDSRDWKPIADKENNRIMFEPKELEPDLQEIQQKTQEDFHATSRFLNLQLWAIGTFNHEQHDKKYYASWADAFTEAQALLEQLNSQPVSDLARMSYGGIVTAAAIFIRDYSDKLAREDMTWCAEVVYSIVLLNVDSEDLALRVDKSDYDGVAAASSVLPILFGLASEDEEKLFVKALIATAITHPNPNVRQGIANGIREHLWQQDSSLALYCVRGALEYARLQKSYETQRRRTFHLDSAAKEIELEKLQVQKEEFREQFVQGNLPNKSDEVTLETHSAWHILAPCLMIPEGSIQPEHIRLLSQILELFFVAERNERRHRWDRVEQADHQDIHYEIRSDFTAHFARHLLATYKAGGEEYIELLRSACDTAPDFLQYLIICVAVEAEQQGLEKLYWRLWKELSPKVQEIAIELSRQDSYSSRHDERRKLIRRMLATDIEWKRIDVENQSIAEGKELILEFVTNTGKNPAVFESLAKLMYYFPGIFFESGVHSLAIHQREEGGLRLFSGINTTFYLERAIQRFLQTIETGPLKKSMHQACLILLDAIVETASARGYYLREHLVRSRRTL